MKKRFLALLLALVLCLGLAVPALAAEEAPAKLSFSLPGGVTAVEETATFQIQYFNHEIHEDFSHTYTYHEAPTREEVSYTALPLSAKIIFENIRPGDGLMYFTSPHYYSDPDGDGIYEERLFYYDYSKSEKFDPDNYSIIPLTEKGPFNSPDPAYSNYITAHTTPISGFLEEPRGTLTVDVDQVVQLFGPNTLIRVDMQLELRGKPIDFPQPPFWFLLTGEGTPEADPAPDPSPKFTDLLSWCEKEAVWAAQEGITNGYGAKDKFAPGVDCTQAQILTFLWRAENKPEAAKSPITVAASYQDAVNWAYEKGMIDDSFNPDAPCTRSQAVSYIWQAKGTPEAAEAASFSDVDAGASYAGAVSWAVEKGITNGYGGNDTFAPNRVCSRGQIVCFLYRAYND